MRRLLLVANSGSSTAAAFPPGLRQTYPVSSHLFLLPSLSAILFHLLVLLTATNTLMPVSGFHRKEFQKNFPVKTVWAVPGMDADLPCDVTPPVPTDRVKIVFWFKDSIGMPLYSLDVRAGHANEAQHLAMSDDLGSRSYFIVNEQPALARLRIHNVSETDEGVFRCRVDFHNSPTRNFQVNLALVELPTFPRIFDAEGREILQNISAGPFLQDRELFLSCEVTGGRPSPSVTWWYNGSLLDGVVDSNKDSFATVNQLLIQKVARQMRKSTLECRAAATAVAAAAPALVRAVHLTVYLKPDIVTILSNATRPYLLVSAQKGAIVVCETSGSYPPAKITWLMDGRAITNAAVKEVHNQTSTISTLSLIVTSQDDGRRLHCRADNPRFPGGSAEDLKILQVAYPPKVTVKLLRDGLPTQTDNDNEVYVQEGGTVRLHCDSFARPMPHSFAWYQDGHLVPFNETAGVLPVDNSFTLKSARRNAAGQYACSAANTEGETYSSPLTITVQYAPQCRPGFQSSRLGFIAHEMLVVQCHVDAVPPVSRFSWTYNTSTGVWPIQGVKMQNLQGMSTLHFVPVHQDIESVSCWATNAVGKQHEPCTINVVPAITPESPRNCYVIQDRDQGLAVEVSCEAGQDGGLNQNFVLEVKEVHSDRHNGWADSYSAASNSITKGRSTSTVGGTTLSDEGGRRNGDQPLCRVLGERPNFRLHNLDAGRHYQIEIYAENAKGRSQPPVVLPLLRAYPGTVHDFSTDTTSSSDRSDTEHSTSSQSSSQTNNGPLSLTWIIATLSASAILLIIGILAATCVIACNNHGRRLHGTDGVRVYDGGCGGGGGGGGSVSEPVGRIGGDGSILDGFLAAGKLYSGPDEQMELAQSGSGDAVFDEDFRTRSAQYRASMYGHCIGDDESSISPPLLIEGPPDLIQAPVSLQPRQYMDY